VALEGLREARSPNPNRRAYFVMEALEAVVAAVAELRPGDPMGGRHEDVAAGIFSAFDGLAWQLESSRPRIIDPRNPPPPGPWESEERRMQMEDRELLYRYPDLQRVAGLLRDRAQADAGQLQTELAPLLARYR
jgi:hypothetical protein